MHKYKYKRKTKKGQGHGQGIGLVVCVVAGTVSLSCQWSKCPPTTILAVITLLPFQLKSNCPPLNWNRYKAQMDINHLDPGHMKLKYTGLVELTQQQCCG